MSKTPYELRFEIFKQAYNMLSDNYHVEFALAEATNAGCLPTNFAVSYPTLTDVLRQAEVINNFVSETK